MSPVNLSSAQPALCSGLTTFSHPCLAQFPPILHDTLPVQWEFPLGLCGQASWTSCLGCLGGFTEETGHSQRKTTCGREPRRSGRFRQFLYLADASRNALGTVGSSLPQVIVTDPTMEQSLYLPHTFCVPLAWKK